MEERKKVNWIRWDIVCKSKKDGGLGVKNLELFNVDLYAKWRWRFLSIITAFGCLY
jgi:hypothetical protein